MSQVHPELHSQNPQLPPASCLGQQSTNELTESCGSKGLWWTWRKSSGILLVVGRVDPGREGATVGLTQRQVWHVWLRWDTFGVVDFVRTEVEFRSCSDRPLPSSLIPGRFFQEGVGSLVYLFFFFVSRPFGAFFTFYLHPVP